jgi:hypothetical protein
VVVPLIDDMHFEYAEVWNSSNLPEVRLSWVAPSDSGYGDRYSAKVSYYRIEVARCWTFQGDENTSSCTVVDDIIFLPAGNITAVGNPTVVEPFQYLMTYTVTGDLQEGFAYYYRLTPTNFWGTAISSFETKLDFVHIPLDSAVVDFPASMPVPVAIVDANTAHVWIDGSYDTFVYMHVSGFPQIRDLRNMLTSLSLTNATLVPTITLNSSNVLGPCLPPSLCSFSHSLYLSLFSLYLIVLFPTLFSLSTPSLLSLPLSRSLSLSLSRSLSSVLAGW